MIALKHDRKANIVSLDLDLWNQTLIQLAMPSMPYYANRTYLSTTALLFVETFVRLNKYACKGIEMLKLLASLLNESRLTPAHHTLLLSSAIKYLKFRKMIKPDYED